MQFGEFIAPKHQRRTFRIQIIVSEILLNYRKIGTIYVTGLKCV